MHLQMKGILRGPGLFLVHNFKKKNLKQPNF